MRNYLLLIAILLEIAYILYCIFGKTKRGWVKFFNILVTVVLLLGTAWFFLFPGPAPLPVTGPYAVIKDDFTYIDAKRLETFTDDGQNRQLTVSAWYPQVEGTARAKYPLVVFSHGSFGIRTSNETLYRELASHGYVVFSIDHTYHSLYTKDVTGKTTWISSQYMKALSAEDASGDPENSYRRYQEWMALRMGDISFIIDAVKKFAIAGEEGPYLLVDTERIGVMGHSMGGSAALGIGRARTDVSAVVSLEAPFMYDVTGVKDGVFLWNEEEYPVPLLHIYSDSSWGNMENWPQYRQNVRFLTPTEGNTTYYNVHLSGAGHLTLTDLSRTSPVLTRLLNGHDTTMSGDTALLEINALCLRFFDTALKGEGTMQVPANE